MTLDVFLEWITPTEVDEKTGKVRKVGIKLGADQRLLLRTMCRFKDNFEVLSRGFGKCVTGDTLIITPQGMKEIGSYFNYLQDDVETYIKPQVDTVLNKDGQMEKVMCGVYSGLKDTKILKTKQGIEIETSLNHPLLIMDKDGKINWKKAEELEIGDFLVTRRGDNIWGSNINLNIDMDTWVSKFSKNSKWKVELSKCKTPNVLTEELALIMGYLVGDGTMTYPNEIVFSNVDEDILKNFHNFFTSLGLQVKKKKGDNCDYRVGGSYIREYFRQLGLKQVNAYNKEIPPTILEAPKEIIVSFLKGLYDTDGSVFGEFVQFSTASEKMSRQLQTILLNFGVVSTRIKKYNKKFKTYHYVLDITGKDIEVFYKEVGFGCKRKQEKLKQIVNNKQGKYNTNKDIIPYQHKLVQQFVTDVKPYNSNEVGKSTYHVRKGNNQLTYEKLHYLLHNVNNPKSSSIYEHFKKLENENYFFSPIVEIVEGENHVYDLALDNTHSFVSNGLISHNTTFELLALYIMAILYPESTWSMSAQTLETSAGFFSDKHADIMRFYPMLEKEIASVRITNNKVEIVFKNKSVITNVTNSGNAKGLRRNGLVFEEAALMNFNNYRDNTQPLTSEELKSLRYQSEYDPYAINKQNFVTTAYYKNEAFEFCKGMIYDMINCRGAFVFGASYRLPAKFGRGKSAEEVETYVDKVGQLMFNFNYASRWSVNNGACIVDIDLLKELQTLVKPEMKAVAGGEYYVGVDVARSTKTSNNASAIAVIKVIRDSNDKIRELQAVNLIKLPNGMNFKEQSIISKKIAKIYNAQALVVDINGLGKGLMDYLLDEQILEDGEVLGALNMINTGYTSPYQNAPRLIYGIEAQSNNTAMITSFVNIVETKLLRLLQPFDINKAMDIPDENYMISDVLPFLRTENFIAEVQNITVQQIPGKSTLKIGQLTKADKDIFSALEMVCWYIMAECNRVTDIEQEDVASAFSMMIRKPKIYG